jgi:hypothetical protein
MANLNSTAVFFSLREQSKAKIYKNSKHSSQSKNAIKEA